MFFKMFIMFALQTSVSILTQVKILWYLKRWSRSQSEAWNEGLVQFLQENYILTFNMNNFSEIFRHCDTNFDIDGRLFHLRFSSRICAQLFRLTKSTFTRTNSSNMDIFFRPAQKFITNIGFFSFKNCTCNSLCNKSWKNIYSIFGRFLTSERTLVSISIVNYRTVHNWNIFSSFFHVIQINYTY